ncbi:MAG: protein-export chaperone SecB [Alphaproteobacteria bacterium]|nr:protein-export chaperone SecB [Alphaproteobacteria bacterium]
MTQNVPNIQVNAQYIKDLSFEAPGLPQILSEITKAPSISVNVDIQVTKTDNEKMFIVELNVKAAAQTAETQKALFICELVYGALVTLELPPEHIEPVLLVEVPHLLFPYARTIVSNTTRDAGLPPLQINPIDFASLYRQKLEQKQQK